MSLSDQLWCPTSVQVTVLQARGLRIKGKSGTNDAYAVMQVGKEKYQTSVAEKSVAPVWKEEATFDLPQGAGGGVSGGSTDRSTLHVHVLHRALMGPDKLLGQAAINLLQLSEDKTRNKSEWFKLLDKTGKADKDRGEVFVDIQFMRNNMTASMFDLSGAGKSRSRLGKFKDKVRGKKKESDTASTIVQPFTQVLTDSEEEGNDDVEETAGKEEKKKKKKIKSLFSTKSNLQRNMSQSMSVLPAKNSTLSGSQSSGLNVDSSEGKKKFKFMIHKRSGSSDSKDSSSVHQKHVAAEQSNLCINGSHIYCEEPQHRTSRIGSNFSLASSGHGSMEDVPESSPPSVDSLRSVRQYSPWTEEEEETAEAESIKEDVSELREEEERIRMEEENRRKEEEMVRRQEEEEAVRLAEEKRRLEEEQRRQREEEERAQEERRRQEEESKLAEEKRRLEEEERRRTEEEKIRKEEEERIQREEEERRRREEEERAKREEEERERLEEEKRRLQEQERRRIEEEEKRQKEEEEKIRMAEERAQEQRRRQDEEERARRQEEEHKLEEEKRRLEEERRIEEENTRKEEEERIRREEERRRQEEEEMVRRQEEHEEMRRLEEQERRQREEEERIKKEEENARREKEEYETLLEEKRKLEEEERKRLEAEEEIRKEEEARIRVEEERRRKEEEERVKREEEELKRLAEEKMKLEEQERRRIEEEERQREEMIRKEEERRKEEEERARKEKEEYERLVEEKMRQEEQERRRLEEEERIRKEEQERIRMEEEKRRREEEEKRIIEEEEKMKKEEEKRRREEEEEKRIIEEEEKMKKEEEERIRKEEEARKLEEVKRDAEDQKKRENQTQTKSTVESQAEVTSTNPFDENFSSNPFVEIPNSPAANVSTVQQRNQSAVPLLESKASADEKDLISTQREKRLAPQPPGKTQAERQSQREQDGNTRHLAQINKQSKDKDVKTVSVHPQRSVQMIAPLSRSPTDGKNPKSLTQSSTTKGTTSVAKNSKRPALSKPRSVEEGPSSKPKTALSSGGKISNERGSKTKQEPVVYGLNPFEDDEDENELTAKDDSKTNTGSVQWPPAVPRDADKDATSQAKIKSSKMAPAPPLPANKASTSSTLINQKTEGGHVKVDTSVTVPDNSVTQPCDPEHAQKTRAATAQSSVEKAGGKKDGPPVTSRRLQPVKPLNPLGQQSASVVRGETDNKSTEILGEVQEDRKVNNTELKGPYSQLTREELISLVLKQENQMTDRDKKISQLEQYIDNLLVRVMEEKPSILMSMNSLK